MYPTTPNTDTVKKPNTKEANVLNTGIGYLRIRVSNPIAIAITKAYIRYVERLFFTALLG